MISFDWTYLITIKWLLPYSSIVNPLGARDAAESLIRTDYNLSRLWVDTSHYSVIGWCESRGRPCCHIPLQWRHNGRDGVSNHQPHDCLLSRLQIKENIKAPRHWPLGGEFTGDRWIPRTNGQWRGKCFHLMTSSCRENPVGSGTQLSKCREISRYLVCRFEWRHMI